MNIQAEKETDIKELLEEETHMPVISEIIPSHNDDLDTGTEAEQTNTETTEGICLLEDFLV